MRAREILDEDYNKSLNSDINNLLIGVKGNGVTEISTRKLVDKLQASGYSVSIDSLMTLLQNNPVVTNATPEFIELVPIQSPIIGKQQQDTAAQVSDLAQKATKIS